MIHDGVLIWLACFSVMSASAVKNIRYGQEEELLSTDGPYGQGALWWSVHVLVHQPPP